MQMLGPCPSHAEDAMEKEKGIGEPQVVVTGLNTKCNRKIQDLVLGLACQAASIHAVDLLGEVYEAAALGLSLGHCLHPSTGSSPIISSS